MVSGGTVSPMMHSLEGYVEYKRREFCKDVKCSVQLELNNQTEGSVAYESTRKKCSTEYASTPLAVPPLGHGERLFDS
jgi:hypothetical protein